MINMTMDNFDTKIEAYLLGELSGRELEAFEQALEKDAELARAVAKQREMMERLEGLRLRNKVAASLKDQRNMPGHKRGTILKGPFIWLLSGLLVLAFGLWYFMAKPTVKPPVKIPAPAEKANPKLPAPAVEQAQKPLPDDKKEDKAPAKERKSRSQLMAMAQQFQQAPTVNLIRDAENPDNSASKSAFQFATEEYEKGDFKKCLAYLNSKDGEDLPPEYQFLRASANFKRGKYKVAATDFEALTSSFRFQYDARWNYMLCQMALGNMDWVNASLEKMVANQDDPFHERALELKSRL